MNNNRDIQTPEWLKGTFTSLDEALAQYSPAPEFQETGYVLSIDEGIAHASGLPGVQYRELIRFPQGRMGMAFNLDPDELGIVLLDPNENYRAGSRIYRTGRVTDVPVGEAMLGRVVDAIGRPLDEKGDIRSSERRPVERQAAPMLHRAPVQVPLQTGIKTIDALIPVGRGQRELIVGDRQTGKTAIAVDTMVNQARFDVLCIYCSVGQKSSDTARVISTLEEAGMMEQSIVVVAQGDDPPGLQFIAPYAATAMGEYFMDIGRDVLIVYDDITHHARAYRELSLLLRRPPAREAYPGDIFYIHSRLLERATHLNEDQGGGSLTALPIVETQAQNISAYIPTNLISITDGQIYLSPQLFRKGVLPAVDVGRSVSRVGGKTQLKGYRDVAGDLRLSYSQFEEVEKFARYSTRLDESTRKTLNHGRRVREMLKQKRNDSHTAEAQVALLMAVNEGLFDDIALDRIAALSKNIQDLVQDEFDAFCDSIRGNEIPDDGLKQELVEAMQRIIYPEDELNEES